MLFRTGLLLSLLLLGACASAPKPATPDVEVVVERADGGDWTATYRFARAAPAWAFPRSAVTVDGDAPWRPQAWTVETPGVRLERRGRHDVLSAGGAPLTSVRVRFKPFGEALVADYRPTLQFSDGGLAHFTNQFEVLALSGGAATDALPAELDGVAGVDAVSARLVFRDPGRPVLFGGAVSTGGVVTTPDAGTYAYFGDRALMETEAVAGVVDPALPGWIRTELDAFTPRLLAHYAERLGPRAGGRPTVFAAWGGTEIAGYSFQGSVLDGLLVMDFRGAGMVDANDAMTRHIRWFLGHETAHFWLGQTIRQARQADAWITEGGADLLAVRALEQLVPGYDGDAELKRALDDCVALTGPSEPLKGALDRGEHRAQYACGSILSLAAEAGLRRREPDADAFTFWRRLIEANRADGVVTAEEWLAAFQQATGDAALTAEVRGFLNQGVDDPTAFMARLFSATGLAHALGPDGGLRLT